MANSTNKTQATDTIKAIVKSDLTNARSNRGIEGRYLATIGVIGYDAALTQIESETAKFKKDNGKYDRATPEGERIGDRVSKIRQLRDGSNADGKKLDKPKVSPLPAKDAATYQSFSAALKARKRVTRTLTDAQKVEAAEKLLATMIEKLGRDAVTQALKNMNEASLKAAKTETA